MRILVEPGDYAWTNLGDVAMAQVAVTRLAKLWPQARISVLTEDEERLHRFCPGTEPVPAEGQRRWVSDGPVFGGRLYRSIVPGWMSKPAAKTEAYLRHRWPGIGYRAVRLGEAVRSRNGRPMTAFCEALFGADLVVVSGAGDITSTFEHHALSLLTALDLAGRRGARTVLFGQGVGPIQSERLWARMRAVLPRADLITVREQMKSPSLLDRAGVDRGRVMVTGDEALELAYDEFADNPGNGIGINLRCAFYSAVDRSLVESLRPILHEAADAYGAPLVPVPIRLAGRDSDVPTIRDLLEGSDRGPDAWDEIEDPQQLVRQISRCRLVVTGSYHGAVFALAQGIPAVGLARSDYYVDKFLGLADLFGVGCELVRLDSVDFPGRLKAAIDRAWATADEARPLLRAAALRQIEAGKAAYTRCHEIIEGH